MYDHYKDLRIFRLGKHKVRAEVDLIADYQFK